MSDQVPAETGLRDEFAAVGGLDEQIKLVRELVELPLRNPGIFEVYGTPLPSLLVPLMVNSNAISVV